MTTESQWRAQVNDLALMYGWRVYFVLNSTRVIDTRTRGRIRVSNVNPSGVGFPDMVLVRGRDRRLIFAELKRDRGPRGGGEHEHVEPTVEQRAWLADLEAVAALCDVAARAAFEQRTASQPPPLEVHVWRPSEIDAVTEILR